MRWRGCATVLLLMVTATAGAQQVAVQEYVLPNGLRLLMVPRKGDPNVAAGWIARVGSVNERPGITGISHLFEHMMFKGTRVIGTKDIDEELALMARLDEVKAQIRVEETDLARRVRVGEVADAADPASRSERHRALLAELDEIQLAQKALIVPNEFDRIYTSAGASGMNAATSQDYTVYFINVPANKLELWFWMESDRLLNPVFREFYTERDVVTEERRLSVESTPTGKYEEQFDAVFWNSSPYSWPIVGWRSDLDAITRDEALAYFAVNYAPNNLTACLVGDFDPAQARQLADRYFGRLARHPVEPVPVRTREVEPLAERRLTAYAETNPEVEIRYLSVADGHVDEPALVVLGSLLSGRTGRLYRSLVLDQQVATRAFGGQYGLKWDGYFTFGATARSGHAPEEVEQAIYREIDRVRDAPVEEREVQKVKNQFAADLFRRLQSNFGLMYELLVADSNRGWQTFNEDPRKYEAVTAADIQRVANKYFVPERRAVAVYYTKRAETAEPDPLLDGLSAEEQAAVAQMRAKIDTLTPDQAREQLSRLEAEADGAPPEQRRVLEVVRQLLRRRLEQGGGA